MRKSIFVFASFLALTLLFCGCQTRSYDSIHPVSGDYRVYLYGERHGQEIINDKEFALWQAYYDEQNFRHLFLEVGYCDALLLNYWMQDVCVTGGAMDLAEDADYILDVMFMNLGKNKALSHTDSDYLFYKKIKEYCPETIFHGTDVEHQWNSTGAWCLELMEHMGLDTTDDYEMALESVEQGLIYYSFIDNGQEDVFRENMMVQNFERQFDALPETEKVMGIYGNAHVKMNAKNWNHKVDNMATQLAAYYREREGAIIYTADLTKLR